jgi:hypothetical protein
MSAEHVSLSDLEIYWEELIWRNVMTRALERFVLVRISEPWYLSHREVPWRPTHEISDSGCYGPGIGG